MAKKKSTEEFKEEIRQLHGDRYILDEVVYVNNKTKVKLVCPEHGEFWITPNCLLSGQKCKKCSLQEMSQKKTQSQDMFLERISNMYGDKYDTSKTVYRGALAKVDIICKEHGPFQITASHLLEGHGCKECAKLSRRNKRNLGFDKFVELANQVHNNFYQYKEQDYVNNKTSITITCPNHGDFEQRPDDHLRGKGCPSCGHIISKAESEIYDYVCNLVGEENVIHKDTEILEGLEIDVYIPSYNFAIEYNGLRWHGESFNKDKYYHLNKTQKALEKGIFLIHIFEDEWLEHKDLVLEKIAHFLHKKQVKIIGARKCKIREISNKEAEIFLEKYHIQGFVGSTVYCGAFYNDELVGVMSFLHESEGKWNLTRFSTNINYSFPGLANKLFNFFVRNHEEGVCEVKTFLDRRWSHCKENVYNRMNFKLVKIEQPEYRYVVGNKRMHKFGFRKQNLHKKYGLPLSMTEKEMTRELGYDRIWDCGLYKYVWTKP